MIIDYINGAYNNIFVTLYIVCFSWIAVAISMGIDFYFGIQKAKSLGECTTSEGFKRTVKKATYYYALMTFALLFDFFDVITPSFMGNPFNLIPFVSLITMAGLIFTEIKSVNEKAEDKHRRRVDKTFIGMLEVMKNREDVVGKILEHLKEEKLKQNEEKTI